MPEDLTRLDAAAFFTCLVIWFGYGALFDGRFRRPNSINEKMIGIREAWMMRLLDRDNRITGTTLVGHSIRSVTFFASTTLILVRRQLFSATALDIAEHAEILAAGPGASSPRNGK